MADFGEFRRHWRPLLASFLGLGSALSLNSFILAIFAPYLLDEFGWSRSEWAALGAVQMLIMFCLPVAGRLTDKFGVRRVAMVGALSYPVSLIAITQMDGSIGSYLAIYVAQTVICSTTTSTVYSRVVAEVFKVRRGLALGIAGSSPPMVASFAAPLLTGFVQANGWREGYYLVAGLCAVAAVATLLLLETHRPAVAPAIRVQREKGAYRAIFASPVFWIMLAATFLVNTPFLLATQQLKLLVIDQGLPDAVAAWAITAFAVSQLAGRVITGTALDYLPGHLIAAVSFGLPVIGLLLLASPMNAPAMIIAGVALVAVGFGGEGDIIPFLVTRHFGIRIYSTVLGMLSAAMGGAIGFGNLLLSAIFQAGGSYNTYLLFAAAAAFTGSSMFLLLGVKLLQRPVIGAESAAAP